MRISDSLLVQALDTDAIVIMNDSTGAEIVVPYGFTEQFIHALQRLYVQQKNALRRAYAEDLVNRAEAMGNEKD